MAGQGCQCCASCCNWAHSVTLEPCYTGVYQKCPVIGMMPERNMIGVISLGAPGGASEEGMGWGGPENILEMLLGQASLSGALPG